MQTKPRLIARIDLDRLIHNWNSLDKLSANQTAAVVKADAYRHGMRAVALTLWEAGCRFFFVASLDEAITLRGILPDADIGIFDSIEPQSLEAVKHYRLLPSINSKDELQALVAYQKAMPAMLQIDTGMNRLGADAEEVLAIIASPEFQQVDWRLFFSHLASADEPNNSQNQKQKECFDSVLSKIHAQNNFASVPASLVNSAGIMLGKEYHYGLTRPGIGLYGVPTSPKLAPLLKPVMSLHARVLQIRSAKKGETIGYNATATLKKNARLATIAIGYADGLPHSLSNKGIVHKDSLSAPIIGKISMDTTIIDITDWNEAHLKPGDLVDIINDQYTATNIASDAKTISYDMLTRLGLRASLQYAGKTASTLNL